MATGKSMNIVGARVKAARLRRNPLLTQTELAHRLSKRGVPIDRAGISKIEIGMRCVLDYEVVALAKVLGVSVGRLLGATKKS
ncbi:MAG: helix-turn-helix transcriptional regulator [Chloroflexi bacterium]|nr:helix-turn-helix transcriptional regulator [Chloroflexota bacterium]